MSWHAAAGADHAARIGNRLTLPPGWPIRRPTPGARTAAACAPACGAAAAPLGPARRARAPRPGRAGGRPRAVRRPAMAPTRGRRPARGDHPAAPGRSPRPPARYERGLLPPGRRGPKVPHRTHCRIRVKLRSTRGGPQRPHGDPSPPGGGRGRGPVRATWPSPARPYHWGAFRARVGAENCVMASDQRLRGLPTSQ